MRKFVFGFSILVLLSACASIEQDRSLAADGEKIKKNETNEPRRFHLRERP